ncbi:restriction endonuclease subunit S [Ligilactobacillus aviarius]|uniref:restriction endonuclease subunit S n=1 Tax=Ligilactobacillus aviarius TaxID=1606 RepID=UPI0024BB3F58|nr:restriction endonuclease subunit S [Ligilactobacillus aviarius]
MISIWLLLLVTKVWEQRKLLSNIESIIDYRGKTPKKLGLSWNGEREYPALSAVNVENGKINLSKTEHFGDAYLFSKWMKKALKLGQVILTTEAPVGNVAQIKEKKHYILSQRVIAFETDKNLLDDFLYFLLQRNNSTLLRYSTGGTAKGISQKSLKQVKINLTPNISEQKQISQLLNVVKNLITLYERKTRLLGKVRTFLTQRLFSNSSKVSLYFDNKNWSEHKISEFLTERNEKVVPNSSIPLVSFTVEKGVTPKSKRYNREFLVKDDNKKYKITKKDDIVYNPANLKFGAIARNKFGNAAFSPIYVTFITKLNPAFTEFLVRRKNFINLALKYQEGTVYERMAVKSKDFLNLKIYLPNSSRDINHIAQILQSLDTLVSLNKNKVSLITLIKKELLNTMFI